MISLKTSKTVSISITLISLMLVSAMAGTITRQVKAEPDIILNAVVSTIPQWGVFGGYHDIMLAIKTELAKIGITLNIHYYDAATVSDITYTFWDSYGAPPNGWDVSVGEALFLGQGMAFVANLWHGDNIPYVGFNTAPYMNPKWDDIMDLQEQEFDPVKRKQLTDKLQEIFMHDIPAVNMYTGKQYEIWANYFTGWEPSIRWSDDSHWTLDNATAHIPGVLTYAFEASMYGGTNPWFMATYNSEFMTTLTHEALYKYTRDPWPSEINETVMDPFHPDYLAHPFVVRPELASAMPTYSADHKTVTVDLRQDVYWVWPNGTKGPKFDAYDVEFTINAVLDPATGAIGYSELAPLVDNLEVYNASRVIFHLKRPYVEFDLLLADTWTSSILPKFVLGSIPHIQLRNHETNGDPSKLPGTGPFLFKEWVKGAHVTLEKNPHYWVSGHHPTINTINMRIIPDPGARLAALQGLEIEAGYAIPADKSLAESMAGTHNSVKWFPPSVHPLWFNLNNPVLANRYVRMAIAHAIPYKVIFEDILPGWGVEGQHLASGAVPHWIYGGQRLFNEELEPFEYNLTKAQQYLDMYLNQKSGTPEFGPVGDADQSGLVDFTDWSLWRTNIGISATTPINIYPDWPFTIDPDWTNDGDIDTDDIFEWGDNYGEEYPFSGAK